VLGWAMRKLRETSGWSVRKTAKEYGRDASFISRVERGGAKPRSDLVDFYDEQFGGDGLLRSMFETVDGVDEMNARKRAHGVDPRAARAIEGDASTYVDDTVPHGTLMAPAQPFDKIWRVRNSGVVPWRNRRLERQGPLTGPGLIRSFRHYDVPDTDPGDIAEIRVALIAPGYDCTSIAYFKMVNEAGQLCFPDSYQLGLDVCVMVRGQHPIRKHQGGGARPV
jgi:hypothetical protein